MTAGLTRVQQGLERRKSGNAEDVTQEGEGNAATRLAAYTCRNMEAEFHLWKVTDSQAGASRQRWREEEGATGYTCTR